MCSELCSTQDPRLFKAQLSEPRVSQQFRFSFVALLTVLIVYIFPLISSYVKVKAPQNAGPDEHFISRTS